MFDKVSSASPVLLVARRVFNRRLSNSDLSIRFVSVAALYRVMFAARILVEHDLQNTDVLPLTLEAAQNGGQLFPIQRTSCSVAMGPSMRCPHVHFGTIVGIGLFVLVLVPALLA